MNDQELHKHLLILGYTAKWLDYGLLTVPQLSEQLSVYGSSGDQHKEHYRYAAFRNYLAGKETLTNEELARYIELAMADEDRTIAGAALVDVFKMQLTQAQFNRLIAQMEKLGTWTQTVIARQSLLRKLKQEPLSNALFEECFAHGDNFIQEYLIHLSNREQLQTLSSEGRTKRIRNMALEQLKIRF